MHKLCWESIKSALSLAYLLLIFILVNFEFTWLLRASSAGLDISSSLGCCIRLAWTAT